LNEALRTNRLLNDTLNKQDAEISQLRQTRRSSSTFTSDVAIKPKEFKGTKFDGKSENLERFLNAVELDFRLYEQSFPSDVHRVAYAMKGFDEKPDRWVQQFHRHDPKNILGNWERFKG
jgi:hypothetical protein